MLDLAMFLSIVLVIVLWLWPDPSTSDPYDDPENWGQQ